MNFHTDEWIMDKVKQHYDDAVAIYGDARVVGIFYQGSGNYGLDYEGSDVDTKCIIVPTLDELASGSQPVSITHIRENEEHIDFKDIRIMLQVFAKHNINFLEILYTPYYYVNPLYETEIKELINARDKIVESAPISVTKSIYGIASEKFHALEHPYPSRIDWISKFGYDPKQLHHLMRLREFMSRFTHDIPFGECLISEIPDDLVKVKIGCYDLESARDIAKKSMDAITTLRNDFYEITESDDERQLNAVDSILNKIKCKIIKKGIMINLINELNQ